MVGSAAAPNTARRHRHRPERLKAPARFQFSFRFAWPENPAKPKERGSCEPCPMCQDARDHGVAPLCGHKGDEVLWHSRPCVFASCRHHLCLDCGGRSIFVNPGPMPHSCSLDVADAGMTGSDVVAVILGTSRERVEQIEAQALAKLKATLKRQGTT